MKDSKPLVHNTKDFGGKYGNGTELGNPDQLEETLEIP